MHEVDVLQQKYDLAMEQIRYALKKLDAENLTLSEAADDAVDQVAKLEAQVVGLAEVNKKLHAENERIHKEARRLWDMNESLYNDRRNRRVACAGVFNTNRKVA
jgi:ElaB/YqjD/DUF883 family membrane-anchored ribosome-binding protein